MKKRLLSLFLVLALSFSSFTCFAQDKKRVILVKNQEITDINILRERAESGIDESRRKSKLYLKDTSKATIKNANNEVASDMYTSESNNEGDITTPSSAVLKNKDTNEEVKLETCTTTQLLESSVEDNVTTTLYATTAFAAATTLTRSDSGSNTGGDVGASSTIYWSEYTIASGGQNVPVVRLIRATGRWYIYQSGVVLSNLYTEGLQQGWRDPGGAVVDSGPWVVDDYTGFDMRYSFSPIEQDSAWSMISLRMRCDWKRGTGSTYTFEFNNAQNFVN
jgi:hypothetical protein